MGRGRDARAQLRAAAVAHLFELRERLAVAVAGRADVAGARAD